MVFQEFDVQRITIQFGKAYAPGSITLLKSTTGFRAQQMTEFAYMVRSSTDCEDTAAGQVTSSPASLESATCQVYSINVEQDPKAADDYEVHADYFVVFK